MPQTGSQTASGGQSIPENGSGQNGSAGFPEYAESGSEQGSESASGSTGASGAQGGVDYGSEDDPFGDLANGRTGTMTAAERKAVLEGRLEESYGVFDGMILVERERVQADVDDAGSEVMSGVGGSQNGGAGSETFEGGQGSIVIASAPDSSSGSGYLPSSTNNREGDFSNSNQETFPVPEDIPSGDDDDVVARQLREAAMQEPDPELREKLWDEYRNYTGIGQ